jgi:CheY-like chemotaxis protein
VGSRFHFTLPFRLAPAGAARPTAALVVGRVYGAPLDVLLVEDNAVNEIIATRLLQKRGHLVTVAHNGREALTAVEHHAFDLALMDVQMPEMDGLEATCEIRRLELTSHRHLRIVAMTAHAMVGDKERCVAAGMDAYLSKPVAAVDLDAALASASALRPLPAA